MSSRYVELSARIRERWPQLSWQLPLATLLWVASLRFSPVVGFAATFSLSCVWPLLWKVGRRASRLLARSPWAPACEGLAITVLFVAFGWGCLGFVIKQHIPIDRGDHHIMIARAELLTRALSHGQIAHWTHLFQGGDSLTDLYPVFLNWVTALIHLASPAGTAFVDSYSRFCVAAWVLRGVAAYTMARRFAGPLPALLVALASLFDVGTEVSDGTWHGVFFWGMIHNNLALSLGLFAVAFQLDLTRRVTKLGLLRCSLLVALAAIAHPLGMLFCIVSAAALAGATVLRAQRFRRCLWGLGATGLGLLLGGVWISPYVRALALHGFNGSVPGIDYGELGRGLLNGSAPISSYGAWIGFALVALCCSLGSRKVPRLAIGLIGLAFFLLAITPFTVQSRVLEVFTSFLDAQQRRCLTVVKVALIPSLAWLLQHLWRHVARRKPESTARVVLGRALLFALLLLGPARALARGFDAVGLDLRNQFPVPAQSKYEKRENDTDDTYRAVYEWIRERRKADPSPTPWRMTFFDRWDPRMHVHWTWVQGLSTGVPLIDFGWMSANFLRYRPRELSAQGMMDWNVRYAVGVGNADVPGFSVKHRVGPYRIFEFQQYDDRFVLAPAGVTISGLKVTEQSIEFDVAGAPHAGTDVTVRCAWFPRWGGAQAGRAVDVRAVPPHPGALPGQEQLGLRVGSGHVVLTADRAMPGFWLGLCASIFGAAGVVLIMRQSVRQTLETRFNRFLAVSRAAATRVGQRLAPWRVRLLAATFLLALLALVMAPGTRLLIQPSVEGFGLKVSAFDAQRQPIGCVPMPLLGRYACGSRASVEAWVGVTPPADQSGEFGKFWPAIRIMATSAPLVVLQYPRVDARSGKLRLRSTVNGVIELVVRTPQGDTKPVTLSGNQVQDIKLPPGQTRATSLELRLASSGSVDAILRGELGL